ncbi:MAG: hypothetical protein HXY30_14935 [Pseudorhodoplanes sp.]|nr:hypothetical protein [Pseudorhodoplanes sp.]
MPRLVPNWREVLARAWSLRLIALAALLSGAEAALYLVGYRLPLSDLQKALVFFVIAAAAFVARLLAQKRRA